MFPPLRCFAEGEWTPKSNFGLDVEADSALHTPRGYEKAYYLYHETLGISGKLSDRSKSGWRQPGKETGLEFLGWLGNGAGVRIPMLE